MSEDKNISEGRMGLEDGQVATKLIDKSYSPMIVRKYTRLGFPLYIAMICDWNLEDLDTVVHDVIDEAERVGMIANNIQKIRNFTGYMSDRICTHYNSKKRGVVEGVAVLYYVDKMFVSSLFGDFMNHDGCKMELYSIIQTLPHI
jgi:hypothetical protein